MRAVYIISSLYFDALQCRQLCVTGDICSTWVLLLLLCFLTSRVVQSISYFLTMLFYVLALWVVHGIRHYFLLRLLYFAYLYLSVWVVHGFVTIPP